MKRKTMIAFTFMLFLSSLFLLCGFNEKTEKSKVRVLIVPKFEIGEMSGDDPGEAQFFYEYYCAGCEEIDIPNSTPTSQFFFNDENGVGLLVTGSGKTAASLSLMSLLSWEAYDFSDTMIVSVGCGGGSTGSVIFGDVVLVTAACDYELGHRAGRGELENPDLGRTWFPLDSLRDYSIESLNSELYDNVYQMIRDCPLRTTETTRHVLANNFPEEEWAARDPFVMKGTAVSSDSYWKGREDHDNASFIAEYYECPDKYAVTEMEEIGIMNAAECFGLKDRVISLRVIVNMDTFLKGESPEILWLDGTSFSSKVTEENSETVDIFEPGMENLFDAGQIVIDAILAGELSSVCSDGGSALSDRYEESASDEQETVKIEITAPSAIEHTIAPGRHFKAAGTLAGKVPDDAVLKVALLDEAGHEVRYAAADQKGTGHVIQSLIGGEITAFADDTDFSEVAYTAPELVAADTEDPDASALDATVKCVYTDETFYALIVSATDPAHGLAEPDGYGLLDHEGRPYDALPEENILFRLHCLRGTEMSSPPSLKSSGSAVRMARSSMR